MENKKVDSLVKSVEKSNKLLEDLKVSKKIVEKEVKSFGNSAHVVISKKYLNQKVKIIIG